QNMTYRVDDARRRDLYQTAVNDLGIKADFNWYASDNYKLRYGGGISHNWFVPGQISYNAHGDGLRSDTVIGSINEEQAIQHHIYAGNEMELTSWFTFNVGCRLANFRVNNKNYSSVEPRFLVSLNTRRFGAVKASYTKMMQPVHMLTYSSSAFPTDIWLPSTRGIAPGIAVQYSIGYFKSFLGKNEYELSVELYKKRMNKLIAVKGGVPLINTNSWDQNVEINGQGNSQGLELLLRKDTGKNTGWLSYTVANSDRRFENINKGKSY